MNVPNENKIPFREMTAEDRSAIVEAWINNCAEVWNCGKDEYQKAAKDLLSAGCIYRTKPRQLIIPWDVIKPEYKWAAIGFDGAKSVAVFTHEPSISDDAWNYQSSMATVDALNIDTTGINWRESLVQRPKGM